MSVLGTGIAAAVAQTALQAQQVAHQRDQRSRETERSAHRLRQVFETRLKGLEEDDAAEDTTRIHADADVPEHEHQRHEQQARRQPSGQPQGSSPPDSPPDVPPDSPSDLSPPAPASSAQADAPAQPLALVNHSSTPDEPVPPDPPLYRHVDVRA